jgi:hypothetical protein
MKNRSLLAELLLGAALSFSGNALAQEPTTPTAPNPPAAAPAGDPGKDPAVTVTNFLRQFADQTSSGRPSVNTLELLIVDAKLAPGLTAEVVAGTDFGAFKPGIWPSQNVRVEGLNVKKAWGDFFVQAGTIGLWGPPSGDQRTGMEYTLANGHFFDIGGAYGGVMGVLGGGKFNAGNMTVTLGAMAGTGDRKLESGQNAPSLCENNPNACGFVGGINADVQSKAVPGLTLTTQLTRLGNSTYNELRSTLAAQYTRKIGPISWTGAVEGTRAMHYMGGKPELDVEVGSIAASKDLGKDFSIKGYFSETRTQGSFAEQFPITGTALTYQRGSNRLIVDFHNEPLSAGHIGGTVTWRHTFR